MPAFEGTTAQQVQDMAVNKLAALRRALSDVADFNAWLAGLSLNDLQAINFPAADAQTLKSAFADANQLNVFYNGGPLGSYSLPYPFGASQRQVIGPL